MTRLLYWALILFVALVAADFAVSNREVVDLAFWPLASHLTLGLYLATLPGLIAAFFLGWLFGWMRGGKLRNAHRRHSRRVKELEAELHQVKAAHAAATAASAPAASTKISADDPFASVPLTEQQRATLLMSAH